MTRASCVLALSILTGGLIAAGACAPIKREQATPIPPRIARLDPDSASMSGGVVTIVIRGTGFAPGVPGTNTIDFNGMTIGQVASNAAGTELRLAVPQSLVLGGEAPPARVHAGSYTIRVITAVGTSNSVALRILP